MDLGTRGKWQNLCQFCHKPFCSVKNHELESCPQNPDSLKNQKRLANQNQAQASKQSGKDYIEPHSPQRLSEEEDRQSRGSRESRGSTGSVGSQGSKENRPSLPQFERGATSILQEFETFLKTKGCVEKSVMTQYHNMAKRFFLHWEESDPLFIADYVLTKGCSSANP